LLRSQARSVGRFRVEPILLGQLFQAPCQLLPAPVN